MKRNEERSLCPRFQRNARVFTSRRVLNKTTTEGNRAIQMNEKAEEFSWPAGGSNANEMAYFWEPREWKKRGTAFPQDVVKEGLLGVVPPSCVLCCLLPRRSDALPVLLCMGTRVRLLRRGACANEQQEHVYYETTSAGFICRFVPRHYVRRSPDDISFVFKHRERPVTNTPSFRPDASVREYMASVNLIQKYQIKAISILFYLILDFIFPRFQHSTSFNDSACLFESLATSFDL